MNSIKRAGEVHLLDKYEAPAAEAYAAAIASLATAVQGLDHAYFVAKNVAVVKTQLAGKSFVMGPRAEECGSATIRGRKTSRALV
jgi:hypothetical protein